MPTGLQKDEVFNHICDLLSECSCDSDFSEIIRLAYSYFDMFGDKVGFEAIMSFYRFVSINFDD